MPPYNIAALFWHWNLMKTVALLGVLMRSIIHWGVSFLDHRVQSVIHTAVVYTRSSWEHSTICSCCLCDSTEQMKQWLVVCSYFQFCFVYCLS